ncbi:MAG: thiamine-phosphate kinase [Firmicutes bacterium]|nr:thiamine-phosphate kinase [Bacillota bacterium]
MHIKDLGEFGLIRRLAAGERRSEAVIKGVGDDAAVLAVNPASRLLVTGDLMVDGTHFLRDKISGFDLGYKLMAVNLSDIAAMAGTPRFAVVFLGIPDDLSVEAVEEIYRGMRALAERYEVSIVGGDTVRSPSLTLGITLLGEGDPDRTILRSGARPDDLLAVTGTLGRSAAGLAVALGLVAAEGESALRVLVAHNRPQPLIEEGSRLGSLEGVHAMIDISDGLASEVGHICEESGVGAVVLGDEVPIDEDTRKIGEMIGKTPLEMALFGGEDYELLFAVAPECWDTVRNELESIGTRAAVVGRINDKAGEIVLESGGTTSKLTPGGFQHF